MALRWGGRCGSTTGACCPVMNRVNRWRRVFHVQANRERLPEQLGRSDRTLRISLRAFCLMPPDERLEPEWRRGEAGSHASQQV